MLLASIFKSQKLLKWTFTCMEVKIDSQLLYQSFKTMNKLHLVKLTKLTQELDSY
jgi:hypothetical protein